MVITGAVWLRPACRTSKEYRFRRLASSPRRTIGLVVLWRAYAGVSKFANIVSKVFDTLCLGRRSPKSLRASADCAVISWMSWAFGVLGGSRLIDSLRMRRECRGRGQGCCE